MKSQCCDAEPQGELDFDTCEECFGSGTTEDYEDAEGEDIICMDCNGKTYYSVSGICSDCNKLTDFWDSE